MAGRGVLCARGRFGGAGGGGKKGSFRKKKDGGGDRKAFFCAEGKNIIRKMTFLDY